MSAKNVPVKAENRPALRPLALSDEMVNEIDHLWQRPLPPSPEREKRT